jgi:hypothetical protein
MDGTRVVMNCFVDGFRLRVAPARHDSVARLVVAPFEERVETVRVQVLP